MNELLPISFRYMKLFFLEFKFLVKNFNLKNIKRITLQKTNKS
jgi:hypothetical protein